MFFFKKTAIHPKFAAAKFVSTKRDTLCQSKNLEHEVNSESMKNIPPKENSTKMRKWESDQINVLPNYVVEKKR